MNQEEQREAERFEKMTNAIHRAVLETCKNDGELVAINFPVTIAALFNVVVAMAALDPGLNSPADVRRFADDARKHLISSIRERRASPGATRLRDISIPGGIGPDGELTPAKYEGGLQ